MKVQNEMSTRISVDAVSAVGSLSAFRYAIRGASDAWRAQEVALKNSGNFLCLMSKVLLHFRALISFSNNYDPQFLVDIDRLFV